MKDYQILLISIYSFCFVSFTGFLIIRNIRNKKFLAKIKIGDVCYYTNAEGETIKAKVLFVPSYEDWATRYSILVESEEYSGWVWKHELRNYK